MYSILINLVAVCILQLSQSLQPEVTCLSLYISHLILNHEFIQAFILVLANPKKFDKSQYLNDIAMFSTLTLQRLWSQ